MKTTIYVCKDCIEPCILIASFQPDEKEWEAETLSCPLRGHASFKRCE